MKRYCSAVLMTIALAAAATSYAQVSPPGIVLASGLLGPRGLKFGPDGMLYVAEAGLGGSTSSATLPCQQVGAPASPYFGGPTGRISKFDGNGNRTTVAAGLPSALSSFPTGDTLGVADVAFLNGTLYAVLAGGGCSHGNLRQPNGVVQVDAQSGNWSYIADLSNALQKYPAAYPDIQEYTPGDYEPDGTFYSLIGYDGKLYTVEPNHGQIFSITPGGRVEETIDLSEFEGHTVPTSIAANNGNFYVGSLGVFPILPQRETVLTVSNNFSFVDKTPGLGTSPGGNAYRIASSRAGFTTIVGVEFGPDGLAYILEFSSAPGYPTPGDGDVVRVDRDGTIETVVTGLTLPTAMTFGPDGALYVSNFGGVTGAAGQLLKIKIPLLF